MPSTLITSLLWSGDSSLTVKGIVLEAEPTGTRYMLRGCNPPSDTACEYQTAFVELGPWASETLPKGAAETGVYDVHGTVDGTVYSSVCEMSRSVIEKCTVKRQFGFDDSTKYTTTRTKGETGADFTLAYHAATLTDGFEKFASSPEAIPASTASSATDASSTTEASATAVATLDSAVETPSSSTEIDTTGTAAAATDTSSSATPTETDSAGSRPLLRAFTVLTLAGIATTFII